MRTPARSSPWGVGGALLTLTIAAWSPRSLVGHRATDLLLTGIGGLAVGAVLSLSTGIGNGFRRMSALVLAAVVALLGPVVLAMSGAATQTTFVGLWILTSVIAGLDLCFVTRIRLLVLPSGLLLLPLVVDDPVSALRWVLAWFASLLVTLWLLDGDTHRDLDHPEPEPGASDRPHRRPADLLRILGSGLAAGTALALLVGNPGCSFQPLADLGRHLPWPDRIPELRVDDVPDVPLLDLEVDEHGHETRYLLDPAGRRFTGSLTGESLAVVEVDGLDRFLDEAGATRARFLEDGSLLVHGPGGHDVVYRRDDDGWFLPAGDERFHVSGSRPDLPTAVTDSAGDPIAFTSDDGLLHLDPAGAPTELVDTHGTTIPVPPDAVVIATTGIHAAIERVDGLITITDDAFGNRRVYDPSGDLRVEVHLDDGDRLHLAFDGSRDRMTASTDRRGRIGTVRIDREGNAFDPLPDWAERRSLLDRFGPLRPVLIAVTAGVAIALLVRVLRRRERSSGTDDPSWAEDRVRRLESIADGHGIERRPAESVIGFGRRLDTEMDESDGRLVATATILDTALFGHRPLTDAERARVEETIRHVENDRPPLPRRRRRERREHDRADTIRHRRRPV